VRKEPIRKKLASFLIDGPGLEAVKEEARRLLGGRYYRCAPIVEGPNDRVSVTVYDQISYTVMMLAGYGENRLDFDGLGKVRRSVWGGNQTMHYASRMVQL
jgi:hypothetical protein